MHYTWYIKLRVPPTNTYVHAQVPIFSKFVKYILGIIQLLQTIKGKIDRIVDSEPNNTIAVQYVDIYSEIQSAPMKFVIEADGDEEPALVFIQHEFEITIDRNQIGNVRKAELKLFGETYEIHFENTREGRRFLNRMSQYAYGEKFQIKEEYLSIKVNSVSHPEKPVRRSRRKQ